MKTIKLFAASVSLLLAAACSATGNPQTPAEEGTAAKSESAPSPKETLKTALADLLDKRDLSAIDRYWDPGYIQHNPMMPDGSEVVRQMVQAMPGFKSTSARFIADGDLVVVHNRVTGVGPTNIIGFEIFRVANGKLAEHWDVQQPEEAKTVSGRTQIDGPTEIQDLDKTEANRKLVKDFFADVLYSHKMEKLPEYISTTTYNQHNPHVGDGLDGFGKAMAEMAKAGQTMDYKKTHKYIAEGNFVFTLSEGIFAGKNVAFADLFRLQDGKIVEHWDCIHELATESKNKNGMF
jgi:predicted SnoaL-like aldol condensation-catalyzing enzyme